MTFQRLVLSVSQQTQMGELPYNMPVVRANMTWISCTTKCLPQPGAGEGVSFLYRHLTERLQKMSAVSLP